MIKMSAQTFSTTSRKMSEINMRPSDLYDNLYTGLRFYQTNLYSQDATGINFYTIFRV